eukprot:4245744-Pleurochrysis_carterae.AAC.1
MNISMTTTDPAGIGNHTPVTSSRTHDTHSEDNVGSRQPQPHPAPSPVGPSGDTCLTPKPTGPRVRIDLQIASNPRALNVAICNDISNSLTLCG